MQWFFFCFLFFVLYQIVTNYLISTYFNDVFIAYPCMRGMSRVRASLIFCMRKMSQHLSQSFIAEYSPLIFVWFLDRFFNDAYLYIHRRPFFNDVFIAYLYMRKTIPISLQSTFYSNIFTVYLCMIFVCVCAYDCPTTKLVLNQRFIAIYPPLIFVWFLSA